MIDYEWMITSNKTSKNVKEKFDNGELKNFLYHFIYLCKAGFTDKELQNFVSELLQDAKQKEGISSKNFSLDTDF